MGSDLETRISLEDFHRHFVVTHKKGDAAVVFADLERRAHQPDVMFSILLAEWVKCHYPMQTSYQDDQWYKTEIPLDKCYFAHTDFRYRVVPKDQPFVAFMHDKRQEIDSGLFPCSSEIRAAWSGQMPEPLIQERGPGKYYVLDGQLRVIRHWYHQVPSVRVFIYRGRLDV